MQESSSEKSLSIDEITAASLLEWLHEETPKTSETPEKREAKTKQ